MIEILSFTEIIAQIKIQFYNYDIVFTSNLKRIQFLKKIYFKICIQ